MVRTRTSLILLLVTLAFLTGPAGLFALETVYVAGGSANQELKMGYWRNGEWHGVYQSGTPWAITHSGPDVYLAGVIPGTLSFTTKNGDKVFHEVPVYFQGDTMHRLDLGTNLAGGVRDIFVTGSDVDVVGWIADKSATFYHGGYWKNGVWNELSPNLPDNFSEVMWRVKEVNHDVYVRGGTRDKGFHINTGFWKNKVWFVPRQNTRDETYEWTDFATLDGRLVYLGTRNKVPGTLVDGTWNDLGPAGTPGQKATASRLVVSDGDLFVLGFLEVSDRTWVSGSWKNGAWTPGTPPLHGISMGMDVFQGNVYLNHNGYLETLQNGLYGSFGGYFKNGELVEFTHVPLPGGKKYLYIGESTLKLMVTDE